MISEISIGACCGTCRYIIQTGFVTMFGNGSPRCKNKKNMLNKQDYISVEDRLICPRYTPDKKVKRYLQVIIEKIFPKKGETTE